MNLLLVSIQVTLVSKFSVALIAFQIFLLLVQLGHLVGVQCPEVFSFVRPGHDNLLEALVFAQTVPDRLFPLLRRRPEEREVFTHESEDLGHGHAFSVIALECEGDQTRVRIIRLDKKS